MAYIRCSGGNSGGGGGTPENLIASGFLHNTATDYLYIDTGVELTKANYFFIVICPSNLSTANQYSVILEHVKQTTTTDSISIYKSGKSSQNRNGSYPPGRAPTVLSWSTSGSTICIGSPSTASYLADNNIVGDVFWGVG